MPNDQYPEDLFNHSALFFGVSHSQWQAEDLDPQHAFAEAYDWLKETNHYDAQILTWWLTLPKHATRKELGEMMQMSRGGAHHRCNRAWHEYVMNVQREIKRQRYDRDRLRKR